MSTSSPSNLSDAEWECLHQYLPPQSKGGRPPIHSLRSIVDAIFSVLRTGCPWCYLPATFPPWQTVFSHFHLRDHADTHDTKGARCLLAGLKCFVLRLKRIWAHSAYRGQELATWCQATGEWELEIVERPTGTRG